MEKTNALRLLDARDNDLRLRFEVQDTGIGISDEFLNRLFEPFNRSKKVSKVEGTGLGLSIVRHVAESHGGRVGVESTLGVGSTFTVWLPGV